MTVLGIVSTIATLAYVATMAIYYTRMILERFRQCLAQGRPTDVNVISHGIKHHA